MLSHYRSPATGMLLASGLLFLLILILFPPAVPAAAKAVSEVQLKTAFAAFQKAKAAGFTQASVIELYQQDNAVAAVKKLIDMGQSNPRASIAQADSGSMAAVRGAMNVRILQKLAKVTGGTVEVLDFGKENGARSDLDQTIFSVDGLRHYSANEMQALYRKFYKDEYDIDMGRMDMEMYDGDAYIPDWRRQDQTYEEYVVDYARRQQRLDDQDDTYAEPGGFRAQIVRRTRQKGRVTLVNYGGRDAQGRDIFPPPVRGPAAEISTLYKDQTEDVPYRNAASATLANMKKFKGTDDFIDRMKYFNRVMGDGVNALPATWGVDYLEKLGKLRQEDPAAYDSFLRNLVTDVYPELSRDTQDSYARIIRLSSDIELDKVEGRTRSQADYLAGEIRSIRKAALAQGEDLSDEDALSRARNSLFEHQAGIMQRSLVATARTKIRLDLTEERLAMVANKYGEEQARKLQVDSAHQLQRIFNGIDDEAALRHIIAEAPAELRPTLEGMQDAARIVRQQAARPKTGPKLAQPDAAEAKRTGPQEIDSLVRLRSNVEQKRTALAALVGSMQQRYQAFDADLRAGNYSDEAIGARLRGRVMDALGYEERVVVEEMQTRFEQRFSSSKLISNVINLGNLDAVVNVLKVYQQTGDWQQVANTALWELVSNLPHVAKLARLKQIYNDGDYAGLSWMCIAWKLPAAGQVKMVFDVARNSVEIFYHHLMDPLQNDRFDLVYQGYIDRQEAGWSPFQPGWKERQEAVGRSLLHWVPGETFGEKRSNMYSFFQARLDASLRRGGYDPTTDEYWLKRDEILPAFFGHYVTDYQEGRGDWSDNVISGIWGSGTEPQMKQRLIRRLLADFKQGEMAFRQAEVARDEMLDAMRKIDRIQQDNIALERQLVGAEQFLGDRAARRYVAQLEAVAAQPTRSAKLDAEAYPHTVVAGNTATIAVNLVNDLGETRAAGVAQPGPVRVEIRPQAQTPVIDGETDVRLERLQESVADTEFIAPLMQDGATVQGETYLSRADFLVLVLDAVGKELASKTVSLQVVDRVEQKQDANLQVKMLVKRILPKEQPTDKGEPGKVAGLLSNAIRFRYEWADLTPELATPWYKEQDGIRGAPKPSLLLNWPGGPVGGMYWVKGKVSGGIPAFESAFSHSVSSSKRPDGPAQSLNPYSAGGPAGTFFTLSIPMKSGHAGKFTVAGEILYFKQRVNRRKIDTTPPDAVYAFSVPFTYHTPERRVNQVKVAYRKGRLKGYLKVENCQDGTRVVRLTGAGKQSHALLGCRGGKGRVTLDHYWPELPQSLSLNFPDFGAQVTLDAALSYTRVDEFQPPDSKRLARIEKAIARLRKSSVPEAEWLQLAGEYSRMARLYRGQYSLMADPAAWLAATDQELGYWQRFLEAVEDPAWPGFKRYYSGVLDPVKGAQRLARNRVAWRTQYVKVLSDKVQAAAQHDLVQQARAWLQTADAWAKPLLDEEKQGYKAREAVTRGSRALAQALFRTTGDVSAAEQEWFSRQGYPARGYQDFKPGRSPWKIDID